MTEPASERLMAGLETQLTTWLEAEWGEDHVASRELAIDPSGEMPENCPAIWIIDGPETPTGGEMYEVCNRELLLVGFVRKSNELEDGIPTQCNRLIAILDKLWTLTVVASISVMFQTSGPRQLFAGDVEGLVQFPVIVRYTREA
jgi:hypothetical protein